MVFIYWREGIFKLAGGFYSLAEEVFKLAGGFYLLAGGFFIFILAGGRPFFGARVF